MAFFLALLALEAARPLRRRKRRLLPRLGLNLALSVLVFAAGSLVVRPAALLGMAWAGGLSFGLLHFFQLPGWAEFAAGFLLLDLTIYWWHRLNHTRPLLWRFHNVHHVDPDLDVSTSFRFHVGEILYSTLFRLVQVGLIGVMPFTYIFYETIFQCGTMFHHSNLRLPITLERALNKVFVTPRMHGVHHSVVGRETNSNYSVVFSFWDRLHQTLRLNIPQAAIIIGIPGYLLPSDNRLLPLLQLPFRKQRPYWRFPGGPAPRRVMPAAADPKLMAE